MLLLRHASAGERLDLPDLDRGRPLDCAGRVDARELVALLERFDIRRIVSSPHRRCLETVRLLAAAADLAIEESDALAPDAAPAETWSFLHTLEPDALVCTHREMIQRLFGGNVTCEKGGAWRLERQGRTLLPVEYLRPPMSSHAAPRTRAVAASRSRGG